MQCGSCGNDNPAGMKFCGNCAAPLRNLCPKCGFENPPGFKFCGQCAAPLTTAPTPSPAPQPERQPAGAPAFETDSLEGERKTVTALFADIKGSMDLMEDLDPEEARAIVDPAIRRMIDAVHHYGGYIVQSTGDGIFALFGAPLAHEDHPQRALYAALKMQDEMHRYAAELRVAGRPPIEIRIGVNTGEAVIRSIRTGDASAEYTPIGHAVSIASRMQALAPSGSIVIAAETQKIVAGYFELKSLGPARVKGASEPIEVYEVTGLGPLRTRLHRSASRGLSKFVGRTAEIDQMKRVAELARAGHGQIIAAMAEAGVGKSRLFYEFKLISQSGWLVLEAFSVSHGKASAYHPVIDLLKNYFRITDSDDDRARREKITGRVLALDRALEETMPYLFALMGVDNLDAGPPTDSSDWREHQSRFWEQSLDRLQALTASDGTSLEGMDQGIRRARTRDAIKRLLLRESLNQPMMVIFEDLHWIDDDSRDVLDGLADSIGTARMLLMVNYRPEYHHQWANKTYYTQLRLDPLGPETSGELLSGLVGDAAELKPLKEMIVRRTQGNPFFIEEMVQVLFDEGVLARNGEVKLAKPLSSVRVPATVKGIIAARIDRLASAEKELLQTLAVIGKEFPLGLIRHASGKSNAVLAPLLSNLQLGEFIYEQPAAPEPEYVFKHALTQEVAYESVLAERRKAIHERAAAGIEAIFAAQLDDHLDQLALHYSRGGNVLKAIDYFERAAGRARVRSAYEEATRHLSAAIDLLMTLPDSRDRARREIALRVAYGMAFVTIHGFAAPEIEQQARRSHELLKQAGESPEVLVLMSTLREIDSSRGHFKSAAQIGSRMLAIAEQTGSEDAIADACAGVASTEVWRGKFQDARAHFERALATYDRDIERYLPLQGVAVIPGRCLLSWALWALGYPDQAKRRIDEVQALARRLGRPYNTAFALQFAVAIEDFRGEVGEMRRQSEALIELSQEHGYPHWLASGKMSLGALIVEEEDFDLGIALMREGLVGTRRSGMLPVYRFGLILMARAFLRAGNVDHGLLALDESAQGIEADDQRFQEAEIWRLRGEFMLAKHAEQAARENFHRAIEVARAQQARSWELRAATSLARMLSSQDRREEARATLAPVYDWFTEGLDTRDLRLAKTLLDRLA
ncbi:MAG: adenylate/guanylate cyclase domain-containing protein [Candidatus Binataceae bacterium]